MDDTPATQPYRVLARKYRPGTFAALIGQDAMVRTLTNAIAADRLPHAFILTGVRGVGKTSTARIIARALNCVGADGGGGPTAEPCGACEHCTAIAEDRHLDVIEMDAASRSKVEEMRELLDGVRYRPNSARFKIYIIDEVHMLSTHAFNALLKTLEEPPEHVKFIFATTETRKVPVTVLSRCQRFDLRRVDAALLVTYFAEVARREGAEATEGALGLIARAADGSVRDGLSLLDQAIAHAGGTVSEDIVRDMLGLADGGRIYDLFEAALRGAVGDALDVFADLYNAGADPAVILQDLLQATHWLTRLKLAPAAADGAGISELDRERGKALAEPLSIPVLGRTWQLLLKGLEEVRGAPSAAQAAEMVLIRLAYMADMPSPAEVVRGLQGSAAPTAAAAAPAAAPRDGAAATPVPSSGRADTAAAAQALAPESAPQDRPEPAGASMPASFEEAVQMFADRREGILHTALFSYVHPVHFEPGRIAFRAEAQAPSDLAVRVGRLLGEWTGAPWQVTASQEPGAPTLRERRDAEEAARRGAAISHPLVQAALSTFPGATVEAVRDREPLPPDGENDPDFLDSDEDDEMTP